MPKVTVIMPSLNVIKYIRSCMESVLGQSLEDMEVLAIDAGSTDGTLDVLQEYAAKDHRLQIINSDKKSYGYQVNIGLQRALGEYIGIVETDDIIDESMFEVLYSTAVDNDLEYVKGGFWQFVELSDGQRQYQAGGTCIYEKELTGQILSPKDMPELATQDYYLWAGIYRRDLLRNIRLSETPGAAFQDIGFIYQVLSQTARAMYLDKELYHYRQTEGNSSFHWKGFAYLLQEYEHLKRIFECQPHVWKCAYYERLFQQTLGRFERMAVSGKYWQEAEMDISSISGRLRKAKQEGYLLLCKFSMEEQLLYEQLFCAPEKIYDYYRQVLCVVAEPFVKLLKKIGGRDIVIFGCGKYARFVQALLSRHVAGQLRVFCDNDPRLHHKVVQNMEVVPPDAACAIYKKAVFVLSNFNHIDAMKAQLMEMGIEEERIIINRPIIDLRLLMMQDLPEERRT